MSQSIQIIGTFRNNKTRQVGLHNPKNNRIFNNAEEVHVWDMTKKHLEPVKHKFIKLNFKVYFQSGATKSADSLGEALQMLRKDIVFSI
tara:strand:+ start:448 stop:714 length:267 start_codon:yes stop_codon:yes gene_type:complete